MKLNRTKKWLKFQLNEFKNEWKENKILSKLQIIAVFCLIIPVIALILLIVFESPVMGTLLLMFIFGVITLSITFIKKVLDE